MSMTENSAEKHEEQHHKQLVRVKIDGDRTVELAAGNYLVAELKVKLGVAPESELEIVDDGQFRPLADDGHIHIRGGEEFVSHVRSGGSS
jgi:hypothetical protein